MAVDYCVINLDVKVRLIQEADLPTLEWGGEYRHFRYLYREVFENSVKREAVIWVAEYKDVGIVGQLFVQLVSKRKELADGFSRAYLFGFRIQPQYQRLGVGTTLIKIAEEDLLYRGFHWATLNVNRENTDAQRFYRRNGYKIISAEKGRWSYIDHTGKRVQVNEPAWRMIKRLSP
jgi:ribosomal protein S18 acetylase RimI-like enzyme